MSQALPQRYGKYILLRRVAVGGMAEIFRAKAVGAEGFERDIAIKRILPNYTADESFVQMFKDEANIAAKLSHANIVTIFDFDEEGGTYYIAMEFIEGRDLKGMMDAGISAGKPVSPLHVTKVGIDTCAALHHAHTKQHRGQPLNIVHRDVSPHNIMVTYHGDVKLMDFGIAKARQRFTQTQAGLVKGKCAYMSPEQVRGKQLDGRSDVFALGVVLWEMLTRQRLFAGDTDYVTLSNVVKAQVLSPRDVNPEVPEELDRIVLKALHRDRDERPDALELQRELQRFYYTQALDELQSVSEYMHDLFAADIKTMAAQMAEERNAFVGFLSEEKHSARGPTYAAPRRGTEPLDLAGVQEGSGSRPEVSSVGMAAPRPAAPPPSTSSYAVPGAGTGSVLPQARAADYGARTVPLADMQKELQARLSASQDVPRAGTGSRAGYDPQEEDLPETIAMTAIPRTPPGAALYGQGGTPAPRAPLADGTGVAHDGADGSAVGAGSGRRTGLIAVIVAIALAVGVGAFFLVRSMASGPDAPVQPEGTQGGGTLLAGTDGPDTQASPPVGPGGEDTPLPSEDAGATKGEVPLHAAPLTLTVVTEPPDAMLFVNGEKTESRTLEGIERGARLSLRAEKPNYVPFARQIIASPDELVISLKLAPMGASSIEVVIAAPAPADLVVDGRKLGRSPQKVTGQAGQIIRVEANAEGYLAFSDTFTLQPGKPINLPLKRAARLVIQVSPKDAEVKVNGDKIAANASQPGVYEITTLAVGTAVIVEAEATGHRATKEELTLDGEDTVELELRAIRATSPTTESDAKGTVWLNARPWADVYFKGANKGRTPFQTELSPGSYTFTLKKGDIEKSVRVRIKPNAKTTKVVDMAP